LIPEPKELEEVHGMASFGERFNPLNYYTIEEFIAFYERDIKERTEFLENLFKGQEGAEGLEQVMDVWNCCEIPSAGEIQEFYDRHYRLD
ncbi:MAG: hypothetical protein KAW09_02970, partial [Thermoplasmata archaeon]|nr:hypothetical protein [Thermoplasmata archaeon]